MVLLVSSNVLDILEVFTATDIFFKMLKNCCSILIQQTLLTFFNYALNFRLLVLLGLEFVTSTAAGMEERMIAGFLNGVK